MKIQGFIFQKKLGIRKHTDVLLIDECMNSMAKAPDLKYWSDVMSSGQIIIINPEAALFQEKINKNTDQQINQVK